jgi:hypothetical protein
MRPKLIAAVSFEGRILCIEEHGDVYSFNPETLRWTLLAKSPWPEEEPT